MAATLSQMFCTCVSRACSNFSSDRCWQVNVAYPKPRHEAPTALIGNGCKYVVYFSCVVQWSKTFRRCTFWRFQSCQPVLGTMARPASDGRFKTVKRLGWRVNAPDLNAGEMHIFRYVIIWSHHTNTHDKKATCQTKTPVVYGSTTIGTCIFPSAPVETLRSARSPDRAEPLRWRISKMHCRSS